MTEYLCLEIWEHPFPDVFRRALLVSEDIAHACFSHGCGASPTIWIGCNEVKRSFSKNSIFHVLEWRMEWVTMQAVIEILISLSWDIHSKYNYIHPGIRALSNGFIFMTFLTIFLALAAYSEVHGLQNPEAKVGVENIECYVRQGQEKSHQVL